MEIYKNKRSNQYFIFIEKTGKDEARLVTPEAQVKSLRLNLFNELEEREEANLLQNEILTEAQVQRFYEYNKDRSDEFIENFDEKLSPSEQKKFLKKLEKIFPDNSKV